MYFGCGREVTSSHTRNARASQHGTTGSPDYSGWVVVSDTQNENYTCNPYIDW